MVYTITSSLPSCNKINDLGSHLKVVCACELHYEFVIILYAALTVIKRSKLKKFRGYNRDCIIVLL